MMSKLSYRIQLGVIALLAGVSMFVTDRILRSTTCPTEHPLVYNFGCEQHVDFLLAVNTGFFLKALVIVAFVLMLLPEHAYKWWRWFAVVAIPFCIWWINWTAGENVLGGSMLTTRGISDTAGYIFIAITFVIVLSASIMEYVKKSNARMGVKK